MDPAEQVAQVLALVVGTCGDADGFLNITDVCRLLHVSSACRRSLQQTRGRYTVWLDMTLAPHETLEGRLTWLASLLEWLPSHAGLVDGLGLDVDEDGPQVVAQLVQRMLAPVVRLCHPHSSTQLPGPAADLPLPLRLREVELCHALPERVLLEALAHAELEKLVMCPAVVPATALRWWAALAGLTSLQSLGDVVTEASPEDCSRVVSVLSGMVQLTRLCWTGCLAASASRLPSSLQKLALGLRGGTHACLTHLTCLTELALDDGSLVPCTSVRLPASLTTCTISVPLRQLEAPGLSTLCVVALSGTASLAVLSNLATLPSLQRLTLHAFTMPGAASVHFTPEALQLAGAGIGTAIRLTSLNVHVRHVPGQRLQGIDWCSSWSRLTNLRDLVLECVPPGGLLQLTGLTSLTRLVLTDVGLGDVCAAALAVKLTRLQELRLSDTNITSTGLLPTLSVATGLRHLAVAGGDAFVVGDEALLLLTSLTALTHLQLPGNKCSEAAKARLVALLPGLQHVVDGSLLHP